MVPSSQVSDADLTGWINEGYNDVISRLDWPWMHAQGTLTTVASQEGYDFDDIAEYVGDGRVNDETSYGAVARIISIYDVEQRTKLREVSPQQIYDEYGGVRPSSERATHFWIMGRYVFLHPVPSAADRTYRVFYIQRITELSQDTDTPAFESIFHSILKHYGEMRMWQREEDLHKAAAAEAKYAAVLAAMGRWYMDRADDSPWVLGSGSGRTSRTNTPFLDGL